MTQDAPQAAAKRPAPPPEWRAGVRRRAAYAISRAIVHAIFAAGVLVATGTSVQGCRGRDQNPTAVPGPMASALLAFAAEQGSPPEEVARTWTLLEDMAARVTARRPLPGEDIVDRMNAVVFGELGFAREVERTDSRFLLLPSVVSGRQGGCVGLSALYLALGEQLGASLVGVLVPGHFFVRALAAPTRNVELLRRGEAMPDDWYVHKYGPWGSASAYLRPLDIPEVIAVHWFNIGNQRRAAGDLPGASDAYTRAARDFPAFAEASASLGAVDHLTGDLPAAARFYRDAILARPDLPGLAQNLTALETERAAHPAAARRPNNPEPASGSRPRRSSP